jgi:hypothetical protein
MRPNDLRRAVFIARRKILRCRLDNHGMRRGECVLAPLV